MPDQTQSFDSSNPPLDPDATRVAHEVVDEPSADDRPPAPPGYQLRGELGRGGMGLVFRAWDVTLGRDVAVKFLQARYTPDSAAARRFVEEARITSRLQHPGIPPVHQVGVLPDGRPFLVMKLIDGQTLDELLRDRSSALVDLPRFLTIFEQVCQAVGFAHARGIIHRDLKPHNVMVGAFGEVQVMDWGLAKAIPTVGGEAATVEVPPSSDGTRLDTDQSSADPVFTLPFPPTRDPPAGTGLTPQSDMTQAGMVLGTPAYMAPEQASGETGKVGTRSDVFGLGALLCVILTGHPPFEASSAADARMKSIRADLSDAFAALDGVVGERDLVVLCKRCLDPDPAARPADAGEVAKAVDAVREAAEKRAARAELERARMETRAAELRKRRRVWAILGAASILLLTGIGVALWWGDHQAGEHRREREVATARDREGITAALDAAETALRAGHLPDTDAALGLAQKRLADHPDADPEDRFSSLVRDRDMVRDLERAMDRSWTDSQKGIAAFDPAIVALYPAAFTRYGLRVGEDHADKIVAAVQASRIDDELTTGLREWFIIDHNHPGLREVLNRLDPNAERVAIRAAVAENNRSRIRELATQVDPTRLTPGIAVLLGMNPAVPDERAITIMAGAWRANPGNFPLALRISFRLESIPSRQTRLAEAVGWCRVAVALRPRSAAAHKLLANALFDSNDHDGALAEYRAALGINPNLAKAHHNVGYIMRLKQDYPAAVEAFRAALRIDPTHHLTHDALGAVLTLLNDHPAAVEVYRDLVKIRPQSSSARFELSRAFLRVGRGRECANMVADLAKTHPEWLTDVILQIRPTGAAGAALCGTGGGKDSPGEPERAAYRAQALAWCRADLAARAEAIPRAEIPIREGHIAVVSGFLTAPEFAGVRDPARLAELPPAERTEWDKFWTDARKLLAELDRLPKQ